VGGGRRRRCGRRTQTQVRPCSTRGRGRVQCRMQPGEEQCACTIIAALRLRSGRPRRRPAVGQGSPPSLPLHRAGRVEGGEGQPLRHQGAAPQRLSRPACLAYHRRGRAWRHWRAAHAAAMGRSERLQAKQCGDRRGDHRLESATTWLW
jgi:hypothetical protein